MDVEYVRLNRVATDSWLTLKLPYPMDFGDELDLFAERLLEGWEVVSGCEFNPDSV